MNKKPQYLFSWLKKHVHLVKNRGVINDRIKELAEYSGQSEKELKVYFKGKRDLVREAWRKANPQSKDEIIRFYAETESYILADVKWNCMEPSKFNSRFILLDFLQKTKMKHVLDYGAGAGEYCVFLSEKGFDLSYCDVYGKTWQFAEWRFQKRRLPVKMLTHDKPLGMIDVIVCTDVLEHVNDPPALLQKFFHAIKLGGFLVATWAFSDAGDQHLLENKKYDSTIYEILREIGFRQVGENYFRFFQKPSGEK